MYRQAIVAVISVGLRGDGTFAIFCFFHSWTLNSIMRKYYRTFVNFIGNMPIADPKNITVVAAVVCGKPLQMVPFQGKAAMYSKMWALSQHFKKEFVSQKYLPCSTQGVRYSVALYAWRASWS